MNKDFFIKQLDDILIGFDKVKSKAEYEDLSGNTTIEEITTLISKSKATILRIFGDESEIYKDIKAVLKRRNIGLGTKLRLIIGTISALKSDLQNDYLKCFSDIIQAEVFSDYLEISEHLLSESYKDPAAILIGTTLEVLLRELYIENGLDIESQNNKGDLISKKADIMNSDLAKANIYSLAHQKTISTWLGITDSAAHGKYEEYKIEDVSLMLQGVRQFILLTK